MKRKAAPAREISPDGVVVHHHGERSVHRDVGVHQAPELLRVVVPLVPGDDDSSANNIPGKFCKQGCMRVVYRRLDMRASQ